MAVQREGSVSCEKKGSVCAEYPVYDLFDSNKRLNLHERVEITSISLSGASLKGYIYEVSDTLGTPLGWWPCDTTFSTQFFTPSMMEYSILAKNKAVGIEEYAGNSGIHKLYPNPTTGKQTVVINANEHEQFSIDLYDIMGRHLETIYNGKLAAGTNSIYHDLTGRPNSVYLYVIRGETNTTSFKVIKQE